MIVFEDNHILIAEKPPGMETQGAFQESIESYLKEKTGKETVFLHAIHRIDTPVSGLVLFARSSKALSRLNESMREQKIEKWYLAIVEKKVEKPLSLKHYLVHGDRRALVFNKPTEESKVALLRAWPLLMINPFYTLLLISLQTGRYHQIRAQLSHIGHPIQGDVKYGAQKEDRLRLHSYAMRFLHPVTKELLLFRSKLERAFFDGASSVDAATRVVDSFDLEVTRL